MIEKIHARRVNAVLPTEFDNSMSYYELISKLLHKINEVIESENSVEEKINAINEIVERHNVAISNLYSATNSLGKVIDEHGVAITQNTAAISEINKKLVDGFGVKGFVNTLDEIDGDGIYFTRSSEMPTAGYWCIVSASESRYTSQIAFNISGTGYDSLRPFYRLGVSGVFGNWNDRQLYAYNNGVFETINANNCGDAFTFINVSAYASTNLPAGVSERNNFGLLITSPSSYDDEPEYNRVFQIYYEYSNPINIYFRIRIGNLWNDWYTLPAGGSGGGLQPPTVWNSEYLLETGSTSGTTNASTPLKNVFIARDTISSEMNDNIKNGVYHINEISGFNNIPGGLTGTWQLVVVGDDTLEKQILTQDNIIYERNKTNGVWGTWNKYGVIRTTSGTGEIYNGATFANKNAHAEGLNTACWGEYSHAEGINTGANSEGSHVEGNTNYTNGAYAHAEGAYNQANGYAAHAEGEYCNANGYAAHAEGWHTTAAGDNSHASGKYTTANSENQFVCGRYNVPDNAREFGFIVGNGEPGNDSNAFGVKWNGEIVGKGINNLTQIYSGSASVAGDRAVVNIPNFDFAKYRAFSIGICFKSTNHVGFNSIDIVKVTANGITVASNYGVSFYEDTAGNIIVQFVHAAVTDAGLSLRFPVKGVEVGTSIYGRTIEALTEVEVIVYGIE
ncbi:MAG: hypothetical protein MJ237_08375 [bacterium]|nr:hypothetical protein [bacterium]